MKAEDFRTVKRGQFVIFADPWEGVFKALVKDIDIKIRDPDVAGGWSYPYDLTADSGTVQIGFNDTLRIVNLADLVKWSSGRWTQLVKDWDRYQASKTEMEEDLATLNARISDFKGV